MGQRLGQHFLKNENAIANIVGAITPRAGEVVVEIGPGAGALTHPLAEICKKAGATLVAIERDATLAAALTLPGVRIIDGDVLEELPRLVAETKSSRYHLIGNLPYYITGAILRVVSELPHPPLTSVFMVQREVAERICARPGTMNLLAAAVQRWATPQLLYTLPPKDFDPPPKVYSAVLRLTSIRRTANASKELDAKYYDALRLIFRQPRKTLYNNLRDGGVAPSRAVELIAQLELTATARPHDLSIEQVTTLAEKL